MSYISPEQAVLAWLDRCEPSVGACIVRNYIFMTSCRSDDFALDENEALQWFRYQLIQADFPQRRLARVLCVRGLFSFLLKLATLDVRGEKLRSIHYAHQLKAHQSWQQLCQEQLTDECLMDWLEDLEGEG